ncbi:glycosyltransferase family A protein [soil metagenome]
MPTVEVTAIIPVRNGAAFVRDALQSVYDQSWTPAEVIVIDDGSDDNTVAEVSRFPHVICKSQPPLGQAEARNHGARLASQKHIAFLDADDLWSRNKIELQLNFFTEKPYVDIVSGQMIQFSLSSTGNLVERSPPATANLPGLLLMKRDTFWRVGPYSSEWRVGEPIEWWARALDQNINTGSVPHVVLKRRIHEKNLGKSVVAPTRDYLQILHTIVKRRRGEGS